MKKLSLILAMLLCMVSLSGCSVFFEEPSALILPPASDQDEYVEHTLINSFLSDGEHLVVPQDMDNPAKNGFLVQQQWPRSRGLADETRQ